MTDTFATSGEFEIRKSDAYTTPANIDQLLTKASELIEYATMGNAQRAYDGNDAALKVTLSDITCDQVEFWLEVGEESDVIGMRGALTAGRVQVSKQPMYLGQRVIRGMITSGLYYGGAGVHG